MPRHFSNMTPSEVKAFNKDMKVLTGMLYSIVTLKAFFPFFRSPAKISDAVGYGLGGTSNAPYPMPQIAGDKEEQNNPL